jgi:putative lipoic acid-binding regulatory protein
MSSHNKHEVWQFPCTLPIKIMGPAKDSLKPLAIKIIQNHVADFSEKKMTSTSSRTGKYTSLTAQVEFQNKQQVDELFAELAHHQQNGDDISFVI